MAHRKTAFGIAVTTMAAALGIFFLFGIEKRFASIDRAGMDHPGDATQTATIPNPGLSRIRLLVSNPN